MKKIGGFFLVILILLGMIGIGTASPVEDTRYIKEIVCYFEPGNISQDNGYGSISLGAIVEINETSLWKENATVEFYLEGRKIDRGILTANELYYIDCGQEMVNYTIDHPINHLFEVKIFDENGSQIFNRSSLVFYKGFAKPEVTGEIPEIRRSGGIFGIGAEEEVRVGIQLTNTNEDAVVCGTGQFDLEGMVWEHGLEIQKEGPFSPVVLEPGESMTVYSDWRSYAGEPSGEYWKDFIFNTYSREYWEDL